MLKQKYITQAEYDEALADPVYDRVLQTAPASDATPYSYFSDALAEQVIQDLMERKGFYRDTGAQRIIQWRPYDHCNPGSCYTADL